MERTIFYFVCVGAVGVFNLFESLLAGLVVFVGGYAFGRWITTTDPEMLKIVAQSERFKLRYDAGKARNTRSRGALMFRVDRVLKPWKEAAALNAHLNLYGFWRGGAFLTKSGDIGMVMRVRGVDYESLDQAAQEYAVKRLEAALKSFGPGFHIYQYLFKTNRPEIPFADYDDPVVQAAVDQRKEFFAAKLDHIYQIEIFYAVVLEGARSKTGIMPAVAQLFTDPKGGYEELRAQFSNSKQKTLLRSQIEIDYAKLDQRVQSFVRQLSDAVEIEVLGAEECFSVALAAKATSFVNQRS